MKDVLIIGGGPAGLSAAIYAARAGLDFAIIEQMAAGGQAATTQHIENYPGFAEGIGGVELAMAMQTQAENLGAPFLYEQVQKMELLGAEKKIITEGKTLTARSVVLAMGARPRPLGLQGEEELRGKGISYCATCDGFFYKNKEAAVIGGGDTALEDALYLAKFCKQVMLIHRRNEFRAAGRLQEKVRKLENVKLLTPYRPVAFEQEDGYVSGLTIEHAKTGQTEHVCCEGIFIAAGTLPQTQLVSGQVALDEAGYIKTDAYKRTNVPGVFAAGDISTTPLRQVVTACADGAVAISGVEAFLTQQ